MKREKENTEVPHWRQTIDAATAADLAVARGLAAAFRFLPKAVARGAAEARAGGADMWERGRKGQQAMKESKANGSDDFALEGVDLRAERGFFKIAAPLATRNGVAILSEERPFQGDLASRVWVTLDPLCGTKGVFRQRGGLERAAVMSAVLLDGVPVGAELQHLDSGDGGLGFRAGADGTTLRRFGHERTLKGLEGPGKPLEPDRSHLHQGYAVYNGFEHGALPGWGQNLLVSREHGGIFKGVESARGSVGVIFGRLWLGEIVAVIVEPCYLSPWDEAPVQALNDRFGIVTLKVVENPPHAPTLEPFRFSLAWPQTGDPKAKPDFPFWRIAVHESRVAELSEAFARFGA